MGAAKDITNSFEMLCPKGSYTIRGNGLIAARSLDGKEIAQGNDVISFSLDDVSTVIVTGTIVRAEFVA